MSAHETALRQCESALHAIQAALKAMEPTGITLTARSIASHALDAARAALGDTPEQPKETP